MRQMCASFRRTNLLRSSDFKVVFILVFILTHNTCDTYNTSWMTNMSAKLTTVNETSSTILSGTRRKKGVKGILDRMTSVLLLLLF